MTLKTIQKIFPQVKEVKDATKNVAISVSKADSAAGRSKDSTNCALVKACVRQKIADSAIIGLASSYLIKGSVATRYKTSESVGREITSFDRHQYFAAGKNYLLSAISKSQRRDRKKDKKDYHLDKNRKHVATRIVHRTAFVRQMKKV